MNLSQAFQGAEHQAFIWPGGTARALLVHGFPGTPAEVRSLATSLYQAGWTVQGLLLPGHGVQIGTLFDYDYTDWVAAVQATLSDLQGSSHPVLLVGYSMGAALALQAAVTQRPTALVLLAPFWQLGTIWQQWVAFLLKPFFRSMRPFQKANFTDPRVRHGLAKFFPGANLDDPALQQTLRELTVPTRIFEQLYRAGQTAYRLAPQVALPTLVVQGIQDEVVPPGRTRQLIQRLEGPVHYEEVPSGHTIIYPDDPGWPYLEEAVLRFAGRFHRIFPEAR